MTALTTPDTHQLQVIHLHPQNSSRKQRKNSLYRTIARLINRETQEVEYEATSKCNSELDIPSRKRGYKVAVGRVLAKFHKKDIEEE